MSTNDDSQPLHLLLEACASITKTALSYRTLGTTSDIKQGNLSVLYNEEVELQQWLERQILDYRVGIARLTTDGSSETKRKSCHDDNRNNETQVETSKSKNPDSIRRKRIQQLEEDLLDETLRFQQEQRLLSRIQMAKLAQRTSFSDDTLMDDGNEMEQSKRVLSQEALKSRDDQVRIALNKLRRLDGLEKELEALAEKRNELQNLNKSIWAKKLQSTSNSNIDTPTTDLDGMDNKLEQENEVLKRALSDIIAGSGIDWYSNERIRNTMIKLDG